MPSLLCLRHQPLSFSTHGPLVLFLSTIVVSTLACLRWLAPSLVRQVSMSVQPVNVVFPTSQPWPVPPRLRLMAIGVIEVLGTILLGTFIKVVALFGGMTNIWKSASSYSAGRLSRKRLSFLRCLALRATGIILSSCLHDTRQSYQLLDVHSPRIVRGCMCA